MDDNEFFALHITWTCYGTWLPGDSRGHVSRPLTNTNVYLRKENIPGTPHSPADRRLERFAQGHQKGESVLLTPEQAVVVCQSLVKAAQQRGWRILRAAVMRNHVYVVICDCPEDGAAVRRILKGVSQADLSKHAGCSRRWWTAGGSDRYKNSDDAVLAAIQYDADQHGLLAEIVDMRVMAK
jgi:REP element-mobilizing transposase RayT